MNPLLREWLYTFAAFLTIVAVLSIGAWVRSWWEWRRQGRK